MPVYVLKIRYEGTAFRGSQVQGNTPTVQKALDQALATLARHPITSLAASRTDAGVHAYSNFFQVDLEQPMPSRFLYNLNALLPVSLSVEAVFLPSRPGFHARFDALSRLYRYRIYPGKDPFLHGRAYFYPFPLDPRKLKSTAAMIMEYRDFGCFAKRNSQTKTHICHIMESFWEPQGKGWVYHIRANRFLRGMVRAVVGTQLQVARGKYSLEDFRRILEDGDSQRADFSPPGHGLYLEEIEYPPGCLLPWDPQADSAKDPG